MRAILNRAFCVPDGMPTVWVGRLQGHRNMRRVYGPDYMMEMCRMTAPAGSATFCMAARRGSQLLKQQLEVMVPGIDIEVFTRRRFANLDMKRKRCWPHSTGRVPISCGSV